MNVKYFFKIQSVINDYLIITLGIILVAIANYFFLFPCGIIIGGLSGIAAIVNNYFPLLNIGLIMTILNFTLIFLSFLVVGNDFGFKTIYGSFALSFVFWIFEFIIPLKNIQIIDSVFLNLIIGISISGIGMTLIFVRNASTGGTDIGAKIINKKTNIEMGSTLFICDILIVLMAIISFGLFIGIISVFGKILNSIIVNFFISIFKQEFLKKRKRATVVNDILIRNIYR